MEAFQQIKTEIDENYHKFKKSTEFKELISVYFIETSKIEKALKVLNEIPYNKREFRVHQKFIYCYLKLDKIKEALEYVKKIERKVRFFEIKEHKIEFSLLKAIAFILSGDYIFAEMELRNLSVNEKNKNLFFKTLLYCNIKLDREEEITELIEKDESLILDPEYYKILGDYYLYKRNYENSLKFYRIIERKRELTKLETMTLSDIYYRLSDYKNSVNTIKVLKNDYKCESPDIYRNLSLNLFLLGDASNGFFSLKEGIDKFPLDIDLYVRLGKYFIEYGDYNAALKTVDEALQIVKNNKKAVYDKRLDIIKLISMEKNNPNIKEFDFLELREKNNKNPEYYFKTIEYYVKSKKFTDAYREIENISALPLNKTQFEILNIYKLIYADNTENKELYEETKKELLKSQKEKIETKINTAIVYILDEDYDNALDIMNQIDIKLINNFLKNKIFYLKAIVYYMKKDYAVSYKLLQNVIENNKDDPKAPFIKSLIEKEYGDKN
ncbi:MAG TPA: hypothetical protein PLO89_03550 [Spirochaetota bacterium]|nr:hypothetical protein [Spirochaetota bacterium]